MAHQKSFSAPLSRSPRAAHRSLILTILVLLLNACSNYRREPTTAERLKNVQARQATQSDFYIPRKSVDYMADLKDLKDAPKLRDETSGSAKAGVAGQPRAGSATLVVVVVVVAVVAPVIAPRISPAANSAVTIINSFQPNFPRAAIAQGIEPGVMRAHGHQRQRHSDRCDHPCRHSRPLL